MVFLSTQVIFMCLGMIVLPNLMLPRVLGVSSVVCTLFCVPFFPISCCTRHACPLLTVRLPPDICDNISRHQHESCHGPCRDLRSENVVPSGYPETD